MQQYFSSRGLNTILENIASTFSSFFEKNKSVLGVDIGSSAIKIVQLKRRGGKAILETYGELALGPYAKLAIGQATNLSSDTVSQALADVIEEAGVLAKDTGMAIPLASSLITVIQMLTTPGARLDEMVPLEARKYIPIATSEVNINWRIIPDGEEKEETDPYERGEEKKEKGPAIFSPKKGIEKKQVKILLAAIHNDVLGKYQSIAEKNKLELSFFEIEVFSTLRSLLGRDPETVFVLDIGAGTSKLLMVEEGIIVGSHVINRGSQDITLALARSENLSIIRAEEMKREVGLSKDPIHKGARDIIALIMANIFSEATRAIIGYEQRTHKPVKKIILSGGGALLKGIDEIAGTHFEMEVLRGHPFSKVETPAFLENTLREVGPNFAVALGIALRRLEEME